MKPYLLQTNICLSTPDKSKKYTKTTMKLVYADSLYNAMHKLRDTYKPPFEVGYIHSLTIE